MAQLLLILNTIKGLTQIGEIWKFLLAKKWLSIILIISIISTAYFSSNLVKRYYHNKSYDISTNYDELNYFIDRILLKCGDKTGISVSSVALDFNYYEDSYSGRFYAARACDAREIKNRCILDLKVIKPALYSVKQSIDLNSYQLLLKLGNQTNAARFYLRDRKGEQDLSVLDKYSSMIFIARNTDWYQENTLHYLWVTSILSKQNLLYVITYLSGTAIEESECSDPNIILNDIKNFIIKQ